jgi:hypothetical protein
MAAGTTTNGFFRIRRLNEFPEHQRPTHIYVGTVAMTHTNFPNVVGVVGDLYMRQNVSAIFAMQQCTVAGRPGTWATIAS